MTGYRPIGMPAVWGKLVDDNLLPDVCLLARSQAVHCDLHSARWGPGVYRPGPRRFPRPGGFARAEAGLQEFCHGPVRRPQSEASRRVRSADIPSLRAGWPSAGRGKAGPWLGAKVKSVTNLGEVSAAGLPSQAGVILLEVPAGSAAAKAGLKQVEVIVGCNGKPVKSFRDLKRITASSRGTPLKLEIYRGQKPQIVEIPAEER